MSSASTRRIERRAPASGTSGLCVLAALGAVACALLWLGAARSAGRAAAGSSADAVVPDLHGASLSAEASLREPGTTVSRARAAEEEAAPGPASSACAPRTEREFFQAFHALAERSPGALEARAGGLLDGAGPQAEK